MVDDPNIWDGQGWVCVVTSADCKHIKIRHIIESVSGVALDKGDMSPRREHKETVMNRSPCKTLPNAFSQNE